MTLSPISSRLSWLLALGTGLLLFAAFPSLSWWPLGWVALAPLMAAAARSRPRLAALLGLAAGLLFHSLAMPWLITVMNTFGGLAMAVSLGLYLLLAFYLALYTAAFALTVSLCCQRRGPGALLLAPVAWVGAEKLRGVLLTGFPWNLLAYSQADVPAAIQPAALAGAYGLSLLLALSSALAARGFIDPGAGRRVAWRWPAAALMLVIAVLAGGQARIALLGERPAGSRLEAALIQCNVDQELKMTSRDRRLIADELYRLTREATAGRRLDVVVWPESSIPFLRYRREPVFRREIGGLASELDTAVLFGSVDRLSDLNEPFPPVGEQGGGYTNAAMLVDRRGRLIWKYDKIHLVPFGEYVPAKRLLFFADKLVAEVADFTAGKAYAITRLGPRQGGCLICYEIIFSGLVRGFVREGADILVTITNDAWFGDSSAPRQHWNAAVLRAVENGRPVLRCANTGISGVIDPLGRVISETRLNERVIVPVSLDAAPLNTVYTRLGDVVAWGCLALWALMLAALAVRWRARPTTKREGQGA